LPYLTENSYEIKRMLLREINERIMQWQSTYVDHLIPRQTLDNFIASSIGSKGAREIKADLESQDIGQFIKTLFWSRNDMQRFKSRDLFGRELVFQKGPFGNLQHNPLANPSTLGCEIREDIGFVRKKINS